MLSRRRVFSFALGGFLLLSVLGCAAIYWQVHKVLKSASAATINSSDAAISVNALAPVLTSFDFVGPIADLHTAVPYAGDLFLCGHSALIRFHNGEVTERWTVGRELPAAPLRSLAVRTGITQPELWIATEGAGLLVFDGNRFRLLKPQSAGLRDITALLPLHAGRMLIGTAESGVYLSDGSSLRLFHSQFAKTQTTALAGDDDALWIGTRSDGAWFWHGGTAQHVRNELPDSAVLSLAVKNQHAWVGTPLGVSEFVDGTLQRHLAGGVFARALAERDGTLHIATLDEGSMQLRLGTRGSRPLHANSPESPGDAVSFVNWNDGLWTVGPSSLMELSPAAASNTIALPGTLTDGHITSLHADSRGRLWVGYFDRGLDVLDLRPRAAAPVHFEDDLLFCINRIKEDPARGLTAVATANGLALFDASGKLKQTLDHSSGLIANHVTDILFPATNNGSSMIVATPAGLTSVEPGGLASLSGFQGLANNHVYTLAENQGVLYAGTLGGVSEIKTGMVQASFTTANSQLRQNWITGSASFDNRLYLGTYGSGVVQFQSDGTVISYPEFAHKRTEINANAMLATSRALYAGTAESGLAILRAGSGRWQFITAGLPSLNVTALAERDGTLYVGTDNGLVHTTEGSLLP